MLVIRSCKLCFGLTNNMMMHAMLDYIGFLCLNSECMCTYTSNASRQSLPAQLLITSIKPKHKWVQADCLCQDGRLLASSKQKPHAVKQQVIDWITSKSVMSNKESWGRVDVLSFTTRCLHNDVVTLRKQHVCDWRWCYESTLNLARSWAS